MRSQTELAELLAATASRSPRPRCRATWSSSARWSGGPHLVYAVPGEGGDRTPRAGVGAHVAARLRRLCEELLVTAQASANLVVLRTPPARPVLRLGDRPGRLADILGTIAGDDTILLITVGDRAGEAVASRLLSLAGSRED